MNFTELHLRGVYGGTGSSDALTDFLLPALSEAKTYDRVAGYFSSAVFAQTAPGLTELVKKRGKVRLITSHVLAQRDRLAIQGEGDGSNSIEEFANEFQAAISPDDNSLESRLKAEYVKAMCWLLRENLLEIRFVISDSLSAADPEKFHSKFGILTDEIGNRLYFSGSTNETWLAWGRNIENLSIYKSWEPAFREHCDSYSETFEDLWEGENIPGWTSVPLPEAIRQRLIKLAPDGDFPDIESVEKEAMPSRGDSPKEPRNYQLEAVEKWKENNFVGLLEMATGTGKTMTARLCIQEAQTQGQLLVLVVAPYQHISDQWALELSDFDLLQVGASGNWRSELQELEFESQLGLFQTKVVIAVKNTAASEDFVEHISRISGNFEKFMFVGDEVHWLGAASFQNALNEHAEYRLGLSATPDRYFDEEGTQTLRSYFGGESVFVFGLKEALEWRDPKTGDIGVLCPYEYHPIFVELTENEAADYFQQTRRIQSLKGKKDKTPEDFQALERLWNLRSEIAKSADNKIHAFETLIDNLGKELTHALVYCADFDQMKKAQHVSRRHGIDTGARVTGLEGSSKSAYYKGLSEREHILRSFERGKHDVLFAIDCLDEGVDIPSAHLGVILASSGNSKEFIQRRGRLMRKSPGKNVSRIFDFVVLPPDSGGESLRATELRRVSEFGELAINSSEVKAKVEESSLRGVKDGQ